MRAVDIPVQVGGGLRDRDRVAALLKLGLQRVILGTVAVEQPELVQQLGKSFRVKLWWALMPGMAKWQRGAG